MRDHYKKTRFLRQRAIAVLASLLLMVACTEVPRHHTRARLDLTPQQAAAEPGRYLKQRVEWGGLVVDSRNLRAHSELEILAYPLADNGRPRLWMRPLGRFVAVRAGYLETAEYTPGRVVSVVGPLLGVHQGRIGDAPLRLPEVEIQQLLLWHPTEVPGRPEVRFGVGVGSGGSGVGVGIGF